MNADADDAVRRAAATIDQVRQDKRRSAVTAMLLADVDADTIDAALDADDQAFADWIAAAAETDSRADD